MPKRGFKEMLAEANAVIETISVHDLPYHLDQPDVVLVDVREIDELQSEGVIPGSLHVPRGLLEFQADPECPAYNSKQQPTSRIILYCGTGGRSALAGKTLRDMEFNDVASLAGGYSAWQIFQKDK